MKYSIYAAALRHVPRAQLEDWDERNRFNVEAFLALPRGQWLPRDPEIRFATARCSVYYGVALGHPRDVLVARLRAMVSVYEIMRECAEDPTEWMLYV